MANGGSTIAAGRKRLPTTRRTTMTPWGWLGQWRWRGGSNDRSKATLGCGTGLPRGASNDPAGAAVLNRGTASCLCSGLGGSQGSRKSCTRSSHKCGDCAKGKLKIRALGAEDWLDRLARRHQEPPNVLTTISE